MNIITTVQHPAPDALIQAPELDDPRWDFVSGAAKREYFTKSPFATITAYQRGFVVENIVTGGKHPVATWEHATSLRAQLAGRYQTIATRAGW
jgi:hypothetical protein